jgi:beta-galactosidase
MKIPAIGLVLLLMKFSAAGFGAGPPPSDVQQHRFQAANGKFTLDGQPFQIIAGEMHPARIPYQFWEDRIKRARAMGLNTVSLYVFWNQVEPAEGKFNFQGNNDIRRFIQLCQQNGLWVVMRPGPYACAETDFGGYPAWLLKHHDLKLRSDDPAFLEFNRQYLKALHDQVGDLQITHGGPIIMVQMENELGQINKYLADLKQIFIDTGFDIQLFTCDHSGGVWNQTQGLPDVLRATNGLPNSQKLELAEKVAGNFPVYGSEVYTSWFSVWGGRVGGPASKAKSAAVQLKDTQWLLDRNLSFCYYVFDGGTNFGFSNGANGWQPVQTTYDYDAPIDELGRVRPKYKALRDLFTKTFKLELPPIPPDPEVIEIPEFSVSPSRPLLAMLGEKPVLSDDVMTMEDLDQSYGFILYRKKFDSLSGELDLKKALDYSIVMIDGKVVGEAFAGLGKDSFKMKLAHAGPCMLDILVYNLGRNSVGINQSSSRKGLNENPALDGQPIKGWQIYSLPMDDPDVGISSAAPTISAASTPMLYSGEFTLPRTGETYLDMRHWKFGVVWVNGHNLGRFWDVGGDRSLYLPSVWEKIGTNHIVILELSGPSENPTVRGESNLIEVKPGNFHAYF